MLTRCCPVCDSNQIKTVHKRNEFEYGAGKEAVILNAFIPIRHCLACQFEFIDEKGMNIQHNEVCKHLRRLSGTYLSRNKREGHFIPGTLDYNDNVPVAERKYGKRSGGSKSYQLVQRYRLLVFLGETRMYFEKVYNEKDFIHSSKDSSPHRVVFDSRYVKRKEYKP